MESRTLAEPREFTWASGALVGSATVGIACSGGTLPLYTLGVLVGPLQAAFDVSAAAVQSVWFANAMLAALLAPGIGYGVDRFGARPVALVGLFGVFCGFTLLGLLPRSLAGFYVCAGLLTLLAAGSSPITWSRGVARSFTRNRGLALGLALCGSGLAGAFAPAYAAWLLEDYGWRGAYVGLAFLPLCLALPLAFAFFRPSQNAADASPAETATSIPLKQAIKSRSFALIMACFLLISIGVGGLIPNYVPILLERGVARMEAASIAGLIGLSVIAGRIGTGLLLDRFWAPGVLFLVLLLPASACLLLANTGASNVVFYVAAVCIGLAAGAEFDGAAFLIAQYFPMERFGRLYGVLFAGISVTAGAGPALLAYLAERWGSYDPVLWLVATLFVAGALPLLALGRK